jgi:hypothetical protein
VSEQNATRPKASLPFLELATKGPGALFRNFFPFLQMAALPILLFMLSWLAIQIYAPRAVASLLVVLSDRTMTTIFGMAWLGYLLQPESNSRIWLPRWSRQHWLFLFYSLCISVLTALLAPILVFIINHWPGLYRSNSTLLMILLGLPSDYVHASIGLVFCALAVRQPGGPLWSWRLVGWSALKIVVVVSVVSFCFTIAGHFAGSIVRAVSGGADIFRLLSSVPGNLANYASYAVVLGVLAFAYRRLTGWHGVRQEVLERFE